MQFDHCTVLYVLMSAVLTGIKQYTVYLGDSAAAATAFASKPWAQRSLVRARWPVSLRVLLVFQLGQRESSNGDGTRPVWLWPYFARITRVSNSTHHDNLDRRHCWWRRGRY